MQLNILGALFTLQKGTWVCFNLNKLCFVLRDVDVVRSHD